MPFALPLLIPAWGNIMATIVPLISEIRPTFRVSHLLVFRT